MSDLIVGASTADPGGDAEAGECYVVFGKADSSTVDLALLGSAGFLIEGIDPGDVTGFRVAGAGDLDGDGLADLLISASGGDPGGDSSAGEAFVVFGRTDTATVDLATLGATGFRIAGIDPNDSAGAGVSAAGDVNGDGIADIFVSAPSADPPSRAAGGESYVVFGQLAQATSGTYSKSARSGNAPRVPIGAIGDGSDDASPSSRCWIDFDSGTGPGLSGSSLQTVTLTRSNASLSGALSSANTANVVWELATNRTAWTSAAVTFKYTDAEIAGMTEGNLRLYKAPSVSGPWTELATTVDAARNTATATVSSFSFFAFSDQPGLPVEVDSFGVE